LVALSHPTLRPDSSPKAIQRYSQHYIDLIDMEDNQFKTVPAHDVIPPRYKILRYIAQIYRDGFLSPIRSNLQAGQEQDIVLTFDDLMRRTPFPDRMRDILNILEQEYDSPVDMEFAIEIKNTNSLNPECRIVILQCRPQSHLKDSEAELPEELPQKDIIFSTKRMVPRGHVPNIEYILFVPAKAYYALATEAERKNLGRAIGHLNGALKGHTFICIGPGRWGTSNPDLGVKVGYSDIFNSRALVELTGEGVGSAPEPSFGTHFFQDLMESNTYPLAVFLEDEDVIFNHKFFKSAPNSLTDFLDEAYLEKHPNIEDVLHLIRVSDARSGHHMELIMDDDKGKAVAFLKSKKQKKQKKSKQIEEEK
jgi:hypothetical protein